MSYIGKRRGSRKALQNISILHDGTGNATVSYNDGVYGASTPLSTTTWLELFTSITMNNTVNLMEIFDSTGEVLQIGTGGTNGAGNAAAATLLQITPGGNGALYVRIDTGTRLTIKAFTANPGAGTQTVINFYD